MSIRTFRRKTMASRGFSLLEMLVAMLFIGILSAGMLRVYSSNLAGFQRVNDSISTQRQGRWALTTLQDDVASIGYFAFVGFNNPAWGSFSVTSGTQEPFMILPSPAALNITGPDPSNPAGALLTTQISPDELQYVSDLSLPIQATLTSLNTTTLTLSMLSGTLTDVQAGDIVAILDGNFEQFIIASAAGTTVVADLTATVTAQNAGGIYQVILPGTKTHVAGVPLAFYRPSVVTRYSIQPLATDPANAAIKVPCLVRQQTPYPVGGGLITWVVAPGQAVPAIPFQIIAENIDGLRIDLSFDSGTNWRRTAAANWDGIVTNISTALAPLGAAGTPARNATNPLWFRTYPFLVRMDVTSRSPAPRTESTTNGTAGYVRRTQTLMVTPRNLGYS